MVVESRRHPVVWSNDSATSEVMLNSIDKHLGGVGFSAAVVDLYQLVCVLLDSIFHLQLGNPFGECSSALYLAAPPLYLPRLHSEWPRIEMHRKQCTWPYKT